MSVTFLSNDQLHPAINWSLLGEPMRRAFEERESPVVRPSGNVASALVSNRFNAPRAVRRADSVFWMQLSSRPEWQIAALAGAAIGRRRSAYVVDAWPYVLDKIGSFSRIMHLDPCFVAFREAYDVLVERFPRQHFVHLPFGVDEDVFQPGAERDIFALWMGRRHEPLHRALTEYCDQRGLTYVAPRGGSIADPRELGALAGRAKYFVVTPPDLDHPERSGGFSPLVMRYLEGLAAGCRLLGTLPRSGEFETMVPAASLMQVDADGSDVVAMLDRDHDEPGVWDVTAQASDIVRSEHTWRRRADQVIDVLSTPRVRS